MVKNFTSTDSRLARGLRSSLLCKMFGRALVCLLFQNRRQHPSPQPKWQESPSTAPRTTDDYFSGAALADALLVYADSRKQDWLFPQYAKERRSKGPDKLRLESLAPLLGSVINFAPKGHEPAYNSGTRPRR